MIRVPSPAKLNLFLHITGRRENGYHELQSIFQLIDLYDWLEFEPLQEDHIQIDGLNNVDLEQTTQFVVPNRGAMVAARFNANIGYRVLVTVSDRNGKPLPFGALASNDETGQQSIVDEGGILYLSGISSKSQSWTVRWGNQADQQCQFAFSTPDSEPTTSVLQGTAQCH